MTIIQTHAALMTGLLDNCTYLVLAFCHIVLHQHCV
jgi:hypothetical protein